MSHKTSLACAGAFAAAAILAGISPASAHTVIGQRIFPATLTVDDPGVDDEMALPTMQMGRKATLGTYSTEKGSLPISRFPSTARSCTR